MSRVDDFAARPWSRPVGPRDPCEPHRVASNLELLFDLCFVVAVAYAGVELHHAIAGNHAGPGVAGYLTVFFAIWWAWMNFTWHASAYDNDDGVYRIAGLVQVTGCLVIAAGIPRAFEERQFDVVFAGYGIMRVALIYLWLRAAAAHAACRRTCRRYAAGIALAMCGWAVMLSAHDWPPWAWWFMAAVELAVPAWAERTGATPWHPHHIAERYGLFTIIVLGESVLAATDAVREGIAGHGFSLPLLGEIAGGLVILFSLWWIYFAKPAHRFLTSNRAAFLWGYGHYFIFAAAAATGAGLAVNVNFVLGKAAIPNGLAGAAISVPVAAFLLAVWLLHVRPNRPRLGLSLGFPAAVTGAVAASFCPHTVPAVAAVLAALVAAEAWLADRRCRPRAA
jgi:low temperature requirement protein LtrA